LFALIYTKYSYYPIILRLALHQLSRKRKTLKLLAIVELQLKSKMPKSTHSLSHYSASLSRYAPRSNEFKALKFTLIGFIILNIFLSIWVCIYITDQAEWERSAANDDPEKREAVNTWTIWSMTVVIFADVASLVLLYGVWKDNKKWLMVLCVLAFLFSIYGISSVYTRGSITCFVVPFVIATLAIIMIWMVREEERQYEVARGQTLRTGVKKY